ncbi:thioesterase II family protein [Curtobacterium sp. ISL-83]|uniref:thioesterase II family protein n=1 Tax=Curtobacterium sp. ISL-83 TaxID=2819145 RepID=UPI001BEA3733|nr:alpha/beta fold hydrolase [Curtobacterium sp. ISL-83]MBT2502189.1 alpha/beta fold hydrolase [Curtobacterium sp. ISL-83]
MSATILGLPFAGAQADPFQRVRAALPEEVRRNFRTHTYPGHGRRASEPFASTVAAMADDVVAATRSDPPVHLVGWSMGGAVAYEVAARLMDAGSPVASVTFLACAPPPELATDGLDLGTDDLLLDHCEQFGLVDRTMFADAGLRRLFLPALRNDIAAVDRYAREDRRGLLADTTSIAVVQGSADRTVTTSSDWSAVGGRVVLRRTLAGGHFFPQDQPQELATLWSEFLLTTTTAR